MKERKRLDRLTLSFIFFFVFIFLFWSICFFLFNVLKLKDLNLDNSVFASTNIDVEMTGFSDMTLSQFMRVFQSISSPDEKKILTAAPDEKDGERAMLDMQNNGLNTDNIDTLFNGYGGVRENVIFSQRGICVLSALLTKCCIATEYQNVVSLCGEYPVEIKSVVLHEENGGYYAETVYCINVENIRNRILNNFGYPVFDICGKLYIENIYSISVEGGVIGGNIISSNICGIDKENTDKLINALFVAYYLSDTDSKYVLDCLSLSQEILDILTTGLNNMGKVRLIDYSGDRKDISENEIAIEIEKKA